MAGTTPKSQLILGYTELVHPKLPDNRLSLIKNLSKDVILGEIAGLNYRLKTNKSKFADTTLETQRKELYYFCGTINTLYRKYNPRFSKYTNGNKDYPLLFTRAVCLYAMEEIVNSDLPTISGFSMTDSWEPLFQYLLCVNNQITHLTDSLNPKENKGTFSLEELNPRIIPLGELAIESDPVYVPNRSYFLMEFLSKHNELGLYFKQYLQDTYSMDYEELVYTFFSMYLANNKNGENNIKNTYAGEIDTSFFYQVEEASLNIFRVMSQISKNDKPERLISIRKSPFYHVDGNRFILFDNILLLDKGYNQLINDFWFDKVKQLHSENGKPLFAIKYYRSVIGYFFERYTKQIFKTSFANAKYWTCTCFDELKVVKDSQTIELADFYVRYNNKIFIGQAKTTGLYDNEKFGGDVEILYKNKREEFFKSFGVNQLIESIINLDATASQFDKDFPLGKSYHIYPAIVVNEKALQTPFMANVFNVRFQEMLSIVKRPKITVFPLSIIHVSDLEQMEDNLNKTPKLFWQILDYNRRNPKFIPPFFNTLNQLNIRAKYKNPKKLFFDLIPKYQKIPEFTNVQQKRHQENGNNI